MRTNLELEQAIRDIICEIYGKCYVGRLHVHPLYKDKGYFMELFLNTDSLPINIAAELDEENFLKHVRQELRHMHLHHDHYYTGYKAEPYLTPCHERVEFHNNRKVYD